MKPIVKIMATAVMALAVTGMARAQSEGATGKDFGLWTSAAVEKKINKKWSVDAHFKYRLKDNIDGSGWGEPARWAAGVGVSYKVLSRLKLDAGYEFIRDHSCYEWNEAQQEETEGFWGSKHRVYASFTASFKAQNIKIALRERWQYTYRPEVADVTYDWEKDRLEPKKGKGRNVSRTRLQLSYDKKKAWFEPYISAEVFMASEFQKLRYTAGCEFKLNKHNSVDVYYRYQDIYDDDNYNNRDSHIVGVGYKYKF